MKCMFRKTLACCVIFSLVGMAAATTSNAEQAVKTGGAGMELKSPSFGNNQPIPKMFSGEGVDHSPKLEWTNPPGEAKEFALICDDPDAPSAEPWVHWVIYKIPSGTTLLPEGLPKDPSLSEPRGALQGKNSFGTLGYRGPMPPKGGGLHRYFFKLYVLDVTLDLKPGVDKKAVLAAMKGHVIAEMSLVGTYTR